MGYLSIQIQPELAPTINVEGVTSFLKSEGYNPERIEGNDSGKHINLNIETNNIKNLWVKIEKYLQEHNELSNSSIIICKGHQGWDNYLLLHHFDSNEKLNEI